MVDVETCQTDVINEEIPWLAVAIGKVKSLKYGVVQIIVDDGYITRIERIERLHLTKKPLARFF